MCNSSGVNRSRNTCITKENFMTALRDGAIIKATNRGFRLHNQDLIQYEQQKDGISALYIKRPVQDDGVSTGPTHL